MTPEQKRDSQRKAEQKYYAKNRDWLLERRKKRHVENKASDNERGKAYYIKNKISILERGRERDRKNSKYRKEKRLRLRENKICSLCHIKKISGILYCDSCGSLSKTMSHKKYKSSDKGKKTTQGRIRLRKNTDIQFKLGHVLRARFNKALKKGSISGHAVRDLGCSIAELKIHLEGLFLDGMSWKNHGKGHGKWNIDHIYPLSKLDLTDREQLLKGFHYTNLQPLWEADNIRKYNHVK